MNDSALKLSRTSSVKTTNSACSLLIAIIEKLFSAGFEVEEVNELVGDIIPEGDYDTLGGFLISNLGFLPKNEDKNELQFENLKFTILNVEERRIGKVRVEIEPKTEAAE